MKEQCAKFHPEYVVVKKEENVCRSHSKVPYREYKRCRRGEKLSDRKSVGGANRLTDVLIDRM